MVFVPFPLGFRYLGFLLRKNCFPYILDGFRAISLRFREEGPTLVWFVVAVGAVVAILIVSC